MATAVRFLPAYADFSHDDDANGVLYILIMGNTGIRLQYKLMRSGLKTYQR
jgi:hypothetical protein